MSLLSDIRTIDAVCREQGVSLPAVIAWAARAGFGVEARLRGPSDEGEPLEPQTLAEVLEQMSKLSAAIAALTSSVAGITSRLDAAEAWVRSEPERVAAAVADALAKLPQVNEDEAAAAVDAARAAVEKETDDVLNAIAANTPPPAAPAPDAGAGILATDNPEAPPVEVPAASEVTDSVTTSDGTSSEAPTGATEGEPTN